MKKIISLLTITVRSSIYKILLILLGMSGLQLGVFYYTYLKFDYAETDMLKEWPLGQGFGISWTLESLVEKSRVSWIFLIAFALICGVLFWAESERKGSKTFYLYGRLSVTGNQRMISYILYNMSVFAVLFFVEMLTVLVMGVLFEFLVPAEYESVQMYFMAFYKSKFLHCLMPMADIFKWIRNLIVFTAVASDIASAACRKRKIWGVFAMAVMVMFGFVQEIGTFGAMDMIMILTSIVCLAIDGYQMKNGGNENDI